MFPEISRPPAKQWKTKKKGWHKLQTEGLQRWLSCLEFLLSVMGLEYSSNNYSRQLIATCNSSTKASHALSWPRWYFQICVHTHTDTHMWKNLKALFYFQKEVTSKVGVILRNNRTYWKFLCKSDIVFLKFSSRYRLLICKNTNWFSLFHH